MKWFRGGLVFKAHRLLYHATLGSRVSKKKKKKRKKNCALKHTPEECRSSKLEMHCEPRGYA
jgi:hypothetical protein